jgi:ubiquinol-cytochrome c reductase cytochrome b subunit
MRGITGWRDSLVDALALDGIVARIGHWRVRTNVLSVSRLFGLLNLVLVALLFLSGGLMVFYYSPVPGTAYDSVDYAQFNVPFGDVVRGLHYYAANLLLVTLGLHALRGFLVGAYKHPRQCVWASGIVILLVVIAFLITGALLPWDQNAYWTTQVRLSMVSAVPLVGEFLEKSLQGGLRTGIVALTRFYVLHVLFLPVALLVLTAVHLHLLAHRGISAPLWKEAAGGGTAPGLRLLNRWLWLFGAVAVGLGVLSKRWPAPLSEPADPTDLTYLPRPEWWVLWLNQLVTIFKGPLSMVGMLVIPGGLIALLLALPWLDRNPERDPARRKMAMLVAGLIVGILGTLSLIGYFEHFGESTPQ